LLNPAGDGGFEGLDNGPFFSWMSEKSP